MLVEGPHTSIENGVLARQIVRIRIQPRVDVVFVNWNRAPVMPGLHHFQRRLIRNGRERVKTRGVAFRFDIRPQAGNKKIFTGGRGEEYLHALLALAGDQFSPLQVV